MWAIVTSAVYHSYMWHEPSGRLLGRHLSGASTSRAGPKRVPTCPLKNAWPAEASSLASNPPKARRQRRRGVPRLSDQHIATALTPNRSNYAAGWRGCLLQVYIMCGRIDAWLVRTSQCVQCHRAPIARMQPDCTVLPTRHHSFYSL
eukprot:scaffold24828_cov84-Phaeocystis_antarctica.AAC.1